jgi:positive regulator of sigma E activity
LEEVFYEEAQVVEKSVKDGVFLIKLQLFPNAESEKCVHCAACFRNSRRIENTVTVKCDSVQGEKLSIGSNVRISVIVPPIYVPILLVFILPITLLIILGLLAHHYLNNEGLTVAVALGGLVIGLLLSRTVFARLLKKYERRISIVEQL